MGRTAMLLCGLVAAAMVIGLTEALCPVTPCNRMLIPEEFRAPTYVVSGGELCSQCDQRIEPVGPLLNGCPAKPCPMIALPPGCEAEMLNRYFMWEGMMCEDCEMFRCTNTGEIVA